MYSVKSVKTMRGTDGQAYNATLCRDGKKIAEVIEEGSGGEPVFYWADHDAPRVDINIIGHGDQPCTYQGTPEQKLFEELANSQSYTYFGHTGRKNKAILMEDLIENHKLKKTCKTKTVFRLVSNGDNSFQEIKEKFTPELREWLVQRFGDQLVEIVNERPDIREG